MTKFLELQQAQFLGDFTEAIDVLITAGSDSFAFPLNISDELQKSDIIGIAFLEGDGTMRSLITNQILLKEVETSGCFLQIEAKNRKKVTIPLRLFNMKGKPQIYLPITIQSINLKQSRIIFPQNATVTGVVQLVFFTAQ